MSECENILIFLLVGSYVVVGLTVSPKGPYVQVALNTSECDVV